MIGRDLQSEASHFLRSDNEMTGGYCRTVRVIDSHTGGEPTRIVISGGPNLGKGSLADKLECFRTRHDDFRSAVVNGHEVQTLW